MNVFNHQDGQFLEIDGASIYFEIQGNDTGSVIVLLHGGFGSIEDFNPITPYLSKDYRLIGIDSRGHGKSTLGSDGLSYQRIQKDVEAVIQHLRLNDVILIGHSDGGIAALRLAASNTIKVRKLITIGAHWTLKADDPTRQIYADITANNWHTMFPASYDLYMSLNPRPEFDALSKALVRLWLDSSPEGYPNERVKNIRCPLLVVRGDEDMLVSRMNAVELADQVPEARLMNIPFAGHSAHEDKCEVFISGLTEFLNV
jgi:pimeloyl-ACP methyl ester carboxylesterase